MVKKFKTKTFIERLYCDKCGTEMQWTGVCLTSYPAQYPHKCPNCGEEVHTTGVFYPKQTLVEAGEVKEKV